MKTRIRFLLITTLSTFLALVVLSAANAGAVQKRGGDRNADRGRDRDQATVQRSERARDSRSDNRPSVQPRENRGREVRTSDRDRNRDSQRRDNRDSNRNVTRPRSDNPSYDAEREKRLPYTGKIGPSVPITPSNKRTDDNRRDYRGRDSGRNDNNRWDRNDNNRWDRRDSNRWDRNDNKYTRVQERPSYRPPAGYHTPQYRSGRYYYNHTWPRFYNRPFSYGYWVFGDWPGHSHRSVYFYYGYFPYIPASRVIIISRPRVRYVEVPIVINIYKDTHDDYYLERSRSDALESAISDVRLAWLDEDADLLLRHVRSDTRIDVLLDGSYSYTLEPGDYRDMTRDAIENTDTISFQFDSVRGRGDDQVIAYGRHEFYDRDGDRKLAYVSYLFERRGGDWVIIEVGSSLRRLDL